MKQEPSDKLVGLEGHGFLAVIVGIISQRKETWSSWRVRRRLLLMAIRWVYRPRYGRTPWGPSKGGLQ